MENYWDFYWILQFLFYIREDSIPEKECKAEDTDFAVKECVKHTLKVYATWHSWKTTWWQFTISLRKDIQVRLRKKKHLDLSQWLDDQWKNACTLSFSALNMKFDFFKDFIWPWCKPPALQTPKSLRAPVPLCPVRSGSVSRAPPPLPGKQGAQLQPWEPRASSRKPVCWGMSTAHVVPVHVLPCSEVYNSSHSAAGRLSQGVSYLRSPRGWDVTW